MEEKKDEIIDTRTWTIYMHKNKINGKVYIGQTKQSLNERFGCDGHRYDSCPIFFNAINKYGWDNFEHIVLFENIPTRELANRYEEYLIYLYKFPKYILQKLYLLYFFSYVYLRLKSS